ncbi:hypothetical protein BKA82DRAFT_4205505 [Pisolithus tinctorius]|nr:hypothetical protein BKA82DRAFT_4205505 [Pisolithus tinctorius]
MARIDPTWMDVAFEWKHFVCKENAGTRRLMEERFEFRGRKRKKGTMIRTDLATVQVDGNGWSGRFKRLVTSSTLMLKAFTIRVC